MPQGGAGVNNPGNPNACGHARAQTLRHIGTDQLTALTGKASLVHEPTPVRHNPADSSRNTAPTMAITEVTTESAAMRDWRIRWPT